MSRNFEETTQRVFNRGRPPVEFLNFIVDWAENAPEEIFAYNNEDDVYSHVKYKLGPWDESSPGAFMTHRKAAMLEVLRVLSGFESSWDWPAGRDTGAGPQNECQKEAGILQCSGDSMQNFPVVGQWARTNYGIQDCSEFRDRSITDKTFAIEYCARLLRYTYKHHGPLKRTEHSDTDPRRQSIHPFLSLGAMAEFRGFLTS